MTTGLAQVPVLVRWWQVRGVLVSTCQRRASGRRLYVPRHRARSAGTHGHERARPRHKGTGRFEAR
jgi:hypothetical protein